MYKSAWPITCTFYQTLVTDRSFMSARVGNRTFAHAKDVLDDAHVTDKLERIRANRSADLDLIYERLRFAIVEVLNDMGL